MDKRLTERGRQSLEDGDLGDQVGDGLYLKDLGTVRNEPDRSKGEVEQAEPVSKLKRKTLPEREQLPGELAARVMDHYIEHLNDDTMPNPIRDGIPECVKHRYPPGCVHGCQEGVMPRRRDYTLGDVFEWVQALTKQNYKKLLARRPELKGYNPAKLK